MESDRERYNRLHQYDQVVQANRKDVLHQSNGDALKQLPLAILAFAVVGSFAVAGLVALGRGLFYLMEGVWLSSACASTAAINARGKFQVPDACTPVTTDWIGVNDIAQWLLRDLDASLLCLFFALGFLLVLQVYVNAVK